MSDATFRAFWWAVCLAGTLAFWALAAWLVLR